jgi:hypothetical protein
MTQQKNGAENLRTFFFELFIYRMLDANHIENDKKTIINSQTLDGTVMIDDKKFLFECRKVFLPRIGDLDIYRRLMMDIEKAIHEMRGGIGLIGTISMSRPIVAQHRSNFLEKIKLFFKRLKTEQKYSKIDYKHSDKFGSLDVIDYAEDMLVEIKSKEVYDLLFYIKPPLRRIQGIKDHYQVRIVCNFSISREMIYKKLEAVLKEKRKQHKSSEIKNKMIFLDNEILPEFHMNLFANESIYEPEMVRKAYDKLGLEEVLCIVKRGYNEKGPTFEIDVIAHDDKKFVYEFFLSKFKLKNTLH